MAALILGYNSKTIFVVDTASHTQIAEIPPMPPGLMILVNPTFQTLYRNTPYKKFVAGGKKWFYQGDEKNQAKYVGEIKDGIPRGHGTISFPQGDRYVGDFKDGRYHGQGTYTRADGSTRTGEWSNGAFIGPNNNYNVRHAVTNNEGTIAYISHMKGNGISRINLRALIALIDAIPESSGDKKISENDSLSTVAPYRVVNIGNSNTVKLLDFIETIEEVLGKKAIYNFMPMQKGDVHATWANTDLLKKLTGYAPKTDVKDGIKKFVDWYTTYYKIN